MGAQHPPQVPESTEGMTAEKRETLLLDTAIGLRRELHVATRWRRIKVASILLGVVAGVVVAVVLGAYIYGNRQTANHLTAVVACQDAYDQRLATVLQQRAVASQRQTAALQTLIGEVLAIKSHQQFRRDVVAWQAAVRAAQDVPVPPLPPAACR